MVQKRSAWKMQRVYCLSRLRLHWLNPCRNKKPERASFPLTLIVSRQKHIRWVALNINNGSCDLEMLPPQGTLPRITMEGQLPDGVMEVSLGFVVCCWEAAFQPVLHGKYEQWWWQWWIDDDDIFSVTYYWSDVVRGLFNIYMHTGSLNGGGSDRQAMIAWLSECSTTIRWLFSIFSTW